jgi:hypothetical protein
MIKISLQRFRRIFGFLLLIIGLLLWPLLLSCAPFQGLLVNLFFLWILVSILGWGGFLISEYPLKRLVKSWLIGTGIGIPLLTVFLIPLPSEYHLLTVLIVLAGVLLYRHHIQTQEKKGFVGES